MKTFDFQSNQLISDNILAYTVLMHWFHIDYTSNLTLGDVLTIPAVLLPDEPIRGSLSFDISLLSCIVISQTWSWLFNQCDVIWVNVLILYIHLYSIHFQVFFVEKPYRVIFSLLFLSFLRYLRVLLSRFVLFKGFAEPWHPFSKDPFSQTHTLWLTSNKETQ